MDRFLIESPHLVQECDKALKATFAMGYLHNFDWGCKAGVHTGWVTIEAEDEKQAILVVPPFLRNKARAVKLVKFSPDLVKEMHSE